MSYLLSIDPGVEGGWALFEQTKTARAQPPLASGVVIPDSRYSWEKRCYAFVKNIRQEIERIRPELERVICEKPKFHDSFVGQVVAETGSLVKLTYVVGMLSWMVYDFDLPFEMIDIFKWKGQMPKEAVKHQIRKILGERACAGFRTHAWDAVGIGLYYLGHFG